jgi:hypothetical protein
MEPAVSQPPSVTSRRIRARYASTRPLPRSLRTADSQETLGAWILDLSIGGIGLVVETPLALGTVLFVELETCPQAAPLVLWADVVHCQAIGENEYRLGCEFVVPLSEDDLHVLLS